MDYLVIETTGVADPNPIVFTFEKDAALSARCFVESVVTVVNAEAMVDDDASGSDSGGDGLESFVRYGCCRAVVLPQPTLPYHCRPFLLCPRVLLGCRTSSTRRRGRDHCEQDRLGTEDHRPATRWRHPREVPHDVSADVVVWCGPPQRCLSSLHRRPLRVCRLWNCTSQACRDTRHARQDNHER